MWSKHGSRAIKSWKTDFAKREYDTGKEPAALSSRKKGARTLQAMDPFQRESVAAGLSR